MNSLILLNLNQQTLNSRCKLLRLSDSQERCKYRVATLLKEPIKCISISCISSLNLLCLRQAQLFKENHLKLLRRCHIKFMTGGIMGTLRLALYFSIEECGKAFKFFLINCDSAVLHDCQEVCYWKFEFVVEISQSAIGQFLLQRILKAKE